jgi:malonate transporter and related proteins
MYDSLAVVLPVFGLIGLGYASGWFKLLSPKAGEGLSEFVFAFCIPPLIFKTMATATMPAVQPWGYWLAYFIGVAIVWSAAMFISRRHFGVSYDESVVAGFSAGQANTVLVGIPLLLKAFGEPGAVPLFLLIAIHLPITMTSATLLVEGRGGVDHKVLARRLLLHPILMGLMFGLAWRATGLSLSGPFKSIIDYLAGAAIPCSLVAMGLALNRYGIKSGWKLSVILASLKLFVHPAIVYVLAFKVFSMPPVWAGVAVVFAAMPCGVNAYLFGERYKVGVALSSSAIALSTLVSIFSTFFWLWMVGVGAK